MARLRRTGLLAIFLRQTVEAINFYYVILGGGALFVVGGLVMAYNLFRTIRGDLREEKVFEDVPHVVSVGA